MNLNIEKYWRNGEIISAKELNKIELGLLYLDNKITSKTQIQNSGEQYQTFIDDVITTNIVYSDATDQSVVYFTPSHNPIGVLTVTDNNQSYTNVTYTQGDTYVTINGVDLTNKTLYISYFYTESNLSFDQIVHEISYDNALYPAMYVAQYTSLNGVYGFNIYEYSLSSYDSTNYNPNGKLLGTYFFGESSSTINVDSNNLSFTLITQNELSNISNGIINIGDIFYFTLVVPEPQSFGNIINAMGGVNVYNAIYPNINNMVDLGTLGEIYWDENTSQYTGVFKKQFRNIVGTNIYTDNLYSNQIITKQINNTIYKRLLLNDSTGIITTDNKDLYIKLNQYNEEQDTGVQFKVGRQNNFSTTIDLSSLVTQVNTTDLQNLNLPVETITNQNNTPSQRLGYFTNIPNTGDVVYLNKSAIIDYMITKNPELLFTTTSYDYQSITQTYTDQTGKPITITLTINNYIQSINSNNVEYYEFLIYNDKNTPYFSSGSINNFTTQNFQYRSFITNLTNINASESEITVNGMQGGTNIQLYQWNTNTNQPANTNLMSLTIVDYDQGTVKITPVTPITSSTLSQLSNLQSISFIYPLYKLSIKNSQLDIGTRLGRLELGDNIGFVKNNYLEPLVTYIDSGILNFTPSSSSQTIKLNQNINMKDIEVMLSPLQWNYTVSPQGTYEMSLTYQKLQDAINVQFLINANINELIYSKNSYNINKVLYAEKLNTVKHYKDSLKPTSTVITKSPTDNIGMYVDATNNLLRIPISDLPTSLNYKSLVGKILQQSSSHFTENLKINSYEKEVSILPSNEIQPPQLNGINWNQLGYGVNTNGKPITDFLKYFKQQKPNTNISNTIGKDVYVVIPFNITKPKIDRTTLTLTQSTNKNNVTLFQKLNNYTSNTLKNPIITFFQSTDGSNFDKIYEHNGIDYSYTVTNLPPKTYYFYATIQSSSDSNVHYTSNTVQTTITTSLVKNPTLKQTISNSNVQSEVTVPYSIELSGGSSKYNLSISYDDNGQGTTNEYGWNKDINGRQLTNLQGTTIINMNMKLSKVNVTETVKQSITITATDIHTNKRVASYTLYFNYTNTYIPPKPNPSLKLIPGWSNTVVQNKYYTYKIKIQNAPSNYSIKIYYSSNIKSYNKYNWTTDVNGRVLNYTNPKQEYTLPLELLYPDATSNETYPQSITAKLLDKNGKVVAQGVVHFNFQSVYVQPVPTNKISISGLSGKTIKEGDDYTYNINVSGSNSGIYYIRIKYNSGGDTSTNAHDWNIANNGTNISQSFYYEGSSKSFVMPIKLVDKNNENKIYPQSVTATLYNATSKKVVSSTSAAFTFKSIYVQPPPPPPPPPPTGDFTLSVASKLNGSSLNKVNYKSTYPIGNVVSLYFLINGVISTKYQAAATITPGTSGSIKLLTPQNMDGVTGIVGKLVQNTGESRAPIPVANYTIPSSKFTIIESIKPTISLTVDTSSIISGNPFNIKWTAKQSNNYGVQISIFNDSNVGIIFKTIHGSQNYINLSGNTSETETLSITNSTSNIKRYKIVQNMVSGTKILQSSSKFITVEPVITPYTLETSVSPTEITPGTILFILPVNNIVYLTINATAPETSIIDIFVNGKLGSKWLKHYIFTNKLHEHLSINCLPFKGNVYPQYGDQTMNITCHLKNIGTNIEKKVSTNSVIIHQGSKPFFLSSEGPTTVQKVNRFSVGQQLNQDNVTAKLDITSNNNSLSYNSVYINGQHINLNQDISQYLNYGNNEIQFNFKSSSSNQNINYSLSLNSKPNILQDNDMYVQTYDKLQQMSAIKCYQYNIEGYNDSIKSMTPNKLTVLKKSVTVTSQTTYQYTPNYTKSKPLNISLPSVDNARITGVTLYYGKNSNSLQEYTHSYTNNKQTYDINIYTISNPSALTSSIPYNISIIIDWGDGSTTNLTTAKTQNDIGTLNIDSAKIEYLTIDNHYQQIPIKGSVKYLILGKTL